MVTIGVDAHKQVHVAVAVDEVGRPVSEWTGANTPQAWRELLDWASAWEERLWGIEGTGNYGKGLAQHLVACAETVFEVNPRLTAAERRRARKRDKNDRLDAHAVAMAVLRHGDELPRVLEEGEEVAALLKELSRQRKQVESQVARMRDQLHDHLFHLDPRYKEEFPRLTQLETVRRLEAYRCDGTVLQQVRAEGVRHLAALLRLEMERSAALTGQIEELGRRYEALKAVNGVGDFRAGHLAGLLGTRGFRTDAQFAAYGAASPLEASSAGQSRHRFNPGANRELNSTLYKIAVTQWKGRGEGHAYIERRMREGKSWLEAVRALKRHIARRLWKLWNRYYAASPHTVSLAATP
jgi:transposase